MKNNWQIETIDEMLHELEDAKNNQENVLNKVTQIKSEENPAVGNFLEKEINTVQAEADANFSNLVQLIKELQDHRRGFLRQYNLEVI